MQYKQHGQAPAARSPRELGRRCGGGRHGDAFRRPGPRHRAADPRRRPTATSGRGPTSASCATCSRLQAELAGAIAPGRPGQGPAGRAAPRWPREAPSIPTRTTPTSRDASSGTDVRPRTSRRRSNTSSRRSSEIPATRPPIRACRTPTACPALQVLPPRECMPKAEAAARKALALDDTLAEAHASLAGVLYRYHWDWEGAEREFQRSLELDPNYAEGHRAYAIYLLTVRRHEEAVAEARRARELSPLSPVINVELGAALVRVGRYDEAIQQVQQGAGDRSEVRPRVHDARARRTTDRATGPRAVAALEKAASLSGRAAQRLARVLLWQSAGAGAKRWRSWPRSRSVLASNTSRRSTSPIVHLGLGHEDGGLRVAGKGLRGARLRGPRLLGSALRPAERTTRGSRTCCAG